MKTPDLSLFYLIHSLSDEETEAFCRRNRAKGRFVLFNAILKQSVYNEGKIKDEVPGADKHSNFSVKKADLFLAILTFLRSRNQTINNDIHDIEELIARNIFIAAWKKISSSQKLANKEERFEELLLLYNLEKKCGLHILSEEEYEQRVKEIAKEAKKTESLRKNLEKFKKVFNEDFYLLVNSLKPRRLMRMDLVDRISKMQLFISSQYATSSRAKSYYFHIMVLIERGKENFKKSAFFNQRLFDLLEANPFLQRDNYSSYLKCVRRKADFHFLLGETQEGTQILEYLHNLIPPKTNFTLEIQNHYWSVRIPAANEGFTQALSKVEIREIDQFLKLSIAQPTSSTQTNLLFFYAKNCFYRDELPQSIYWLRHLSHFSGVDFSTDLLGISRLLLLWCYALTNDFDSFEHSKGSTLRFLKRHQVFYPLAKKLISFAADSFGNLSRDKVAEFYEAMRDRDELNRFEQFIRIKDQGRD